MLDIRLIRKNPAIAKKDLKKRGDEEKVPLVDDLIKKDEEYRALLQEAQSLRNRRNSLSGAIFKLKKEGKDVSKEMREAKEIPKKIREIETKSKGLKQKIDYYLMRLPNILHSTVPIGEGELDNVEIRKWGKPKKAGFAVKHHGQIASKLDIADFERAVKISGAGFFFLKNELALLDMALQRLAIDLLFKKGYSLVQPPLLMRREPYEGVVDLSDFESTMYKIENEDLYLIATSEHPMAAMYMDEILKEEQLPIRLCGVSPCFRREVGKHGLDERGFFRVHQFNKVEQFIFSKPEQSWEEHEELVKNAEELLKKLEIPYNVTNVCTGDIGTVAAKKYDVNGWSSREQKHIELISVSNCTAYQSTRLNIKYRKKSGEKEYVHTLNATMIATTRALRCILENYQTKEGSIKIPRALQPYMCGLKEIKLEKK